MRCYTCGIVFGGRLCDESEHQIGNRHLCGFCYDLLKRDGKIIMEDNTNVGWARIFLPDGTKKVIRIAEDLVEAL